MDLGMVGQFYSTPQSASIWSDAQRTRYHLKIEAILAKVQAELGIIPPRAAEEIIKHCAFDQIDLTELYEEVAVVGAPIAPLVKQVVRKVNAVESGLGEWTHWGSTTQVRLL